MIAVRMPPRDAQEQRTGESDRSGPQSRTRGVSYCEPLAAGRVARRCAAGLQLVASNDSRRVPWNASIATVMPAERIPWPPSVLPVDLNFLANRPVSDVQKLPLPPFA